MHGSSSGSGPGKKARIEIIPLIDVIFFLLATFVLFTLSLNKSDGVSVSLPKTTTGIPRDRANSVTISVTADGQLAWNKDLISLDEFLARLQKYKASEPNPRVLINGDERALFAQAVYAFDEVRKNGISQVFIETRIVPPAPKK
jgi:biopolymer transport protein ExbD